jgi:hypothetical protein
VKDNDFRVEGIDEKRRQKKRREEKRREEKR